MAGRKRARQDGNVVPDAQQAQQELDGNGQNAVNTQRDDRRAEMANIARRWRLALLDL